MTTQRISRPDLAVRGRIGCLPPDDEARLLDRGRTTDAEVERVVASLIADVRDRRDDALRDQTRRFDGVALSAIEVPRSICDAALDALDPAVRTALEEAAASIAAFHRAQLPPPLEVEVRPGVRLGRRAEPLRRVGVYAPGGRAAYPSSVLMGVIPARVAGVGEVVVCSPPGPDGKPPAAVLAAAALAGADRVFSIGGAGAVAAMAYGTTTVPRVDKIVGPGNAYVTEAKRQLNGAVAIDCPAGPSEILVIADRTADPDLAALELIAQAEHDPDAASVLIAVGDDVAAAIETALARLLPTQPRREIVEAALAASGAALTADSLDDALEFAERYAPEHLLLLVAEPRSALDRVRAAGTIFLGPGSSVAFGDYMTGANHVLPTAGLARAYSGLSALDFVRFTTYQDVSPEAAEALAGPTATLAEAEGLPGHAAAARARGQKTTGAAEAVTTSNAATRDEEWTDAPAAVPLRAAYRDVALYDPGRSAVDVDLSDNTNLFGVNPAAARALAEFGPDRITRYPSVFADALKTELAALHGVRPENITTGCGSDDVIDSAIRAFAEPGDVLAYPDPTFGMVALFGRMNAVRPVAVRLGPDFALDPEALLAARGRVTYLCQPNNPTGNRFESAAIEKVLAESPGIVLLDEAYADFAGETMIPPAIESGRTVVLRTMSKAYGLAGLRIGYAVGPARLIREIEKSRGPYKVTAAAEAAALAVLRDGRNWLLRTVDEVRVNRERLTTELRNLGFRVWPSSTNFVLVAADETVVRSTPSDKAAPDTETSPALRLTRALRDRGVAVRAFPALPLAGDSIRITIGPWPMMEKLLIALREVAR